MPKPKSDVLTEAEQRIMRVLWAKGEASVREVTDALEDSYPVAYTTVLTLLRILTDKDYVTPRQDVAPSSIGRWFRARMHARVR